MNSDIIRKKFLDFFQSKQHVIVPSAPMVVKNDPTLMFTNAGMNQFKDIFLGNIPAKNSRVADTQKCLRVSGKHNDLEEVGKDTYHHTMFEMLGNWSFGDYFKKEAIEWAWELLTGIYKIDKERLYVTVFGGDKSDNIEKDTEAYNYWKNVISEDRILLGVKKDNFWEMGDTGPCGPCSEIHVDIRDDAERKKVDGKTLVNKGNPQVIEIWNLVFIEFNRQAGGKLVPLPQKHVDTGMGFERLCMVLQEKKSNYDTDVFQSVLNEISKISKIQYDQNKQTDIAFRVIADHLRAISFAIADGQMPSNTGAGYVIRRILRRAVRYGFTFLNLKEPFINELVPILVKQMGGVFPELKKQQDIIKKAITEEEISFLKTLENGIHRFEKYATGEKIKKIDGKFAFELYDTYGFPVDLTDLMAKERGILSGVDMEEFNKCLEEQKNRSRQDAAVETADWVVLKEGRSSEFTGYDSLSAKAEIIKYRKVKSKGREFYQLVFDKTPFYAECGGQVGDKGYIEAGGEKIFIENTLKENELTVHIASKLPKDLSKIFTMSVDTEKRRSTEANHSATHLMHAALRQVLGTHVEQKGSFVDDERLRFDFSHFAKLSKEEILKTENIVNEKIRENIPLEELRGIPMKKAQEMGAMALFGEKYGDTVRAIVFDRKFSVELCGGTHVNATGKIGFFKIISEGAIAAGIRRIEAVTGKNAEIYVNSQIEIVESVKEMAKGSKDIVKNIQDLINKNTALEKEIENFRKEKAGLVKDELIKKIQKINEVNFIAEKVDLDANGLKELAFSLKSSVDNLFLVLACENEGKAAISVMISENLVKEKKLNAVAIVKELAKEIDGGGGGQDYFATAGGKNTEGIEKVLKRAKDFVV